VLILAGFLAFLAASVPSLAQDSGSVRVEPLAIVTSSGRTVFETEIADTHELRARGLMFRRHLPSDRAMLFDFKQTRHVMMWMKNTYVSLDMVFIHADGRITKIAENTVPMSEDIIDSGQPVAFVLELAAGTAKRIGLKPGDRIEHRLMAKPAG
jgi:hypothetical protein